MDFRALTLDAARRYGIPENIALRMIKQESGFNPTAVSPKGATGLGQLMPGTAAELGVDPRDPIQNLDGSMRYLRQQFDTFGQWPLALAAYNAGPGRVKQYGGIPPFEETQNYVASILGGPVPTAAGGAPMGLLSMSTSGGMPEQQPMTLGQRVKQNWQSGNILDALMLGFNSMRMNPDQNLPQMVQAQRDRRQQAEMANRTAAWLEANGRPDLAEAVRGGVIDGASAFTVMNQKDERGQVVSDAQLKEMYPGAQIEPGLYNLKSDGTITKVGGGGTTISTADPLKIMPDGRVAVLDPTVDGGVRFVTPPGSPAAADAEKAAAGAAANAESQIITADIVLDEINAIKGKVGDGGLPTTGFFGGLLSNIGGTDAGDISASLDTIKGNIAFDKLQAMRAASPTGGALGSVTENELRLLQSTLGSLEQSQSYEKFLRNLTRLEAIYAQIMQKARAYPNAAEFGFASSGAPGAGVTLSPEAQRYLEGN